MSVKRQGDSEMIENALPSMGRKMFGRDGSRSFFGGQLSRRDVKMNERKTWFGLNGLLALAFLSLFTLTSQVNAADSNKYRGYYSGMVRDYNLVCDNWNTRTGLREALKDESGVSKSHKKRMKRAVDAGSHYVTPKQYCNIAESHRANHLKDLRTLVSGADNSSTQGLHFVTKGTEAQLRAELLAQKADQKLREKEDGSSVGLVDRTINEANVVSRINSRNVRTSLYVCTGNELNKLTQESDLDEQINEVQFGNDVFSCAGPQSLWMALNNRFAKDIGSLASMSVLLNDIQKFGGTRSGDFYRSFRALEPDQQVRVIFAREILSKVESVAASGKSPASGVSQWYTGVLNRLGKSHISREVFASYTPVGKRSMKLSKTQLGVLKTFLEGLRDVTPGLKKTAKHINIVSRELSSDLFDKCGGDTPRECAVRFAAESLCGEKVHDQEGIVDCSLPGFDETQHNRGAPVIAQPGTNGAGGVASAVAADGTLGVSVISSEGAVYVTVTPNASVPITNDNTAYSGGIVSRIGNSEDVAHFVSLANKEFTDVSNSSAYAIFFSEGNSLGCQLLVRFSGIVKDNYKVRTTDPEDLPEGVVRNLHSKLLEIRNGDVEDFTGDQCRYHEMPLVSSLGSTIDSIVDQARVRVDHHMGNLLEGEDNARFNESFGAAIGPVEEGRNVFSILNTFVPNTDDPSVRLHNKVTLEAMSGDIFGEIVAGEFLNWTPRATRGVEDSLTQGVAVIQEAVEAAVKHAEEIEETRRQLEEEAAEIIFL